MGRVNEYLDDRKGQSMVVFALALVVIMGFAALVIDVGQSVAAKASAQKAADAAAMAASLDLPDAGTAISTGEDYARTNGIQNEDITVITPYDGASNKVKVICKKPVHYTFARVIGFTDGEVTGTAVAMRRPWAGDALPFINLDDDYIADPELEAWESVSPGDFESIDNFEMINPDDQDTMYFEVDYLNGVVLKKGTVATVKQEVGWIYDRGAMVYVLSLDDDIIRSGEVMLMDGTIQQLIKLKNDDVIHPSQLVLLKCIFHDYDYTGKHLYLTMVREYDIGEGEFPADYENPDGTSLLIE